MGYSISNKLNKIQAVPVKKNEDQNFGKIKKLSECSSPSKPSDIKPDFAKEINQEEINEEMKTSDIFKDSSIDFLQDAKFYLEGNDLEEDKPEEALEKPQQIDCLENCHDENAALAKRKPSDLSEKDSSNSDEKEKRKNMSTLSLFSRPRLSSIFERLASAKKGNKAVTLHIPQEASTAIRLDLSNSQKFSLDKGQDEQKKSYLPYKFLSNGVKGDTTKAIDYSQSLKLGNLSVLLENKDEQQRYGGPGTAPTTIRGTNLTQSRPNSSSYKVLFTKEALSLKDRPIFGNYLIPKLLKQQRNMKKDALLENPNEDQLSLNLGSSTGLEHPNKNLLLAGKVQSSPLSSRIETYLKRPTMSSDLKKILEETNPSNKFI